MITEIVTNDIHVKNIQSVNIIYGRNNSGKTIIYNRISNVFNYIKKSVDFEQYTLNQLSLSNAVLHFNLNGVAYIYTFSINSNENNDRYVEYESLEYTDDNHKTVVVFTRKNDKVSSKVINVKNIKIALEKYTLVLSLGAFLKINELKQVYQYLSNYNNVNLSSLDVNFSTNSTLYPYVDTKDLPKNIKNKNTIDDIVKFLNIIDESIDNIKCTNYGNNENYVNIFRNNNSTNILLESSGIRALFKLYPIIKKIIDTGGVIYIDNIDSNLDEDAIVKINEYFNSNNTKNAQIIINTRIEIKDYDYLMNL